MELHIYILSLIILGFIMIIILFSSILNISFNKRTMFVLLLVFAVSLSAMSFFAEPSKSDDLYRHYLSIESCRNGEEMDYSYQALLVWKFICYLIAKTDQNGILPLFVVLIEVIVMIYMLSTANRSTRISARTVLFVILFRFALADIFSAISGVRNVFVASIMAMETWKYIKNDKLTMEYIIVTTVMCLIHPVALLYASVLLLQMAVRRIKINTMRFSRITSLVLMGWVFAFELIKPIIVQSDNHMLQLIALKFDMYLKFDTGIRLVTIVDIAICLLITVLIFQVRHCNHNMNSVICNETFFDIAILDIGLYWGTYAISCQGRIAFFNAYLFIPLIIEAMGMKHKANIRINLTMIFILCVFQNMYYLSGLYEYITFCGINMKFWK